MREILFRGKPTERFEHFKIFRPELFTDGFAYGSLAVCGDRYYIVSHAMCSINSCVNNGTTTMVEVIPETVCQFTGKYDIDGKRIFEGDIVSAKMDYGPGGYLDGVVPIEFWYGSGGYEWQYFDMSTIKVVGNKWDNPELLKGE